MKQALSRCWVILAFIGCSCASTQHAAMPLVEARMVRPDPVLPSVPPTVAMAEQTLVPGVYTPIDSMRRRPAPEAVGTAAPSASYDVIAKANRDAESAPTGDGYFNAIQTFSYVPGMLYQVYCAKEYVTDIALQPGEKPVGRLVTGDNLRWVMELTKSSEHGVEQVHVVIKPLLPGLNTNLLINTDRRSYLLELHSYKDNTYMAQVRWRYPQDEVAAAVGQAHEREERQRNVIPLNPSALNFRYALEIEQGDPQWLPTQVFDDTRKTYIRFPASMRSREVPVLFVARDGELQLVNYYPQGEFYVVDRLFDAAELRVGQQRQEIVRIERLRR